MRFVLAVLVVLATAAVVVGAQPMPRLDGYVAVRTSVVVCPTGAVAVTAFVLPGYEDSIAMDAVVVRAGDKPDQALIVLIADWGSDRDYREDPDTEPLSIEIYVDEDRDGLVDVQVPADELFAMSLCEAVAKYAK